MAFAPFASPVTTRSAAECGPTFSLGVAAWRRDVFVRCIKMHGIWFAPVVAIAGLRKMATTAHLPIRIAKEYNAAGIGEDNFSPNIGFMANDPLRVVFLEIRFVSGLFGFAGVFVRRHPVCRAARSDALLARDRLPHSRTSENMSGMMPFNDSAYQIDHPNRGSLFQ